MTKKDSKPEFILVVAVSLDGKITNGRNEGTEWTSKEDKKFFYEELDRADVIVLGRKTFEVIARPLTPRNRIVFTRKRLFSNSQEFKNKTGEMVAFSGSPKKLLSCISRHGWWRILIAGGGSLYAWFLKNKLVDEIYITLEPLVLGSGKPFLSSLASATSWVLMSVKKINEKGTILLHYKASK